MGGTDNKEKASPADPLEDEIPEEDSAEENERLKRGYLLRLFWQTARGFWTGQRRAVAWSLTGGLLLVVLLNIAASYGMNLWNRAIICGTVRSSTRCRTR